MELRRAVFRDITTTSEIAARALQHSPWSQFYRPGNSVYEQNVQQGYRLGQEQSLLNANKIFVVAEAQEYDMPSEPKRVVGFAIWKLPPASARIERNRSILSSMHSTKECHMIMKKIEQERDQSIDPVRGDLLTSAANAVAASYLGNHLELEGMAVDPNYLRQGIGTTLCSYGAGIAEEDGIPVGVIASTLGKDFFTRLGCRTIQQRTVKDTRPGMEAEVDFWVQTWTPVGTSS